MYSSAHCAITHAILGNLFAKQRSLDIAWCCRSRMSNPFTAPAIFSGEAFPLHSFPQNHQTLLSEIINNPITLLAQPSFCLSPGPGSCIPHAIMRT
jgi:hypothetical protein